MDDMKFLIFMIACFILGIAFLAWDKMGGGLTRGNDADANRFNDDGDHIWLSGTTRTKA